MDKLCLRPTCTLIRRSQYIKYIIFDMCNFPQKVKSILSPIPIGVRFNILKGMSLRSLIW